eukprot:gene27007-33664_t
MTDNTRSDDDDHVASNEEDRDNNENIAEGSDLEVVEVSSKRSFDEFRSSETPAGRSSLEAMAAKARAINARNAELPSQNMTPLAKSNLFAQSVSSKLGISRSNLLMDDPEEVDNKLHIWRTNYCSVNAEGEDTPEPTFLELYDNNVGNNLQTGQTFVTTQVPALTKLVPNLVVDFAKRLLGDFNIGLIKMGEDVGIWSLWPVPLFCENLLKVIPRDSSLAALTIALVQQLANIRHDFGDPPTYDTAVAFIELVNTIIHDSTQVLSPAMETAAVKALIAGFIATKHPDKSPRVVQPANIQLHLELYADPSITTVEILLMSVAIKISEAVGDFVKLRQWATIGPAAKQNNNYDKNKDKKGSNQSNYPHGSNTNNQNRGNTSGNDRQNHSNDSACPGEKATCKGHPDRNTSDVPFLQSAAHNKQKARNYQYAHELDSKFRADGSPLSDADVAKIASFKGQNSNKSEKKPKNNKPFHKMVSQFRLSELSHAHSHPFCISGDTVKRSEGMLRAIREREIQRPPLADQQLCVIGEIKAKQELIDTAPDLDHVKWADNPFDWKSNKNRGPPRPQSRDKQKEIAKQVNNYLKLGVIKPVNAEEYSQTSYA